MNQSQLGLMIFIPSRLLALRVKFVSQNKSLLDLNTQKTVETATILQYFNCIRFLSNTVVAVA